VKPYLYITWYVIPLEISNIYLDRYLGRFLEFPGSEACHFVFVSCGHVVIKVTTLFSYDGNTEPVREMREAVRESESR